MNGSIIQLLVLAGIAVFLILRLKNLLGTRTGHEKPRAETPDPRGAERSRPEFEVIEGGPDRDIVDHVPDGSPAAEAFARMKDTDPDFSVSDFLQGARGAYEMILMSYEHGKLDDIRDFLSPDVFEAFEAGVAAREEQGLTVEAEFVGVRELGIDDATFDSDTNTAEITVRHTAELRSVVKNAEGEVVEGDETEVKRQKDRWTYSRDMGSNDPNWILVETDA